MRVTKYRTRLTMDGKAVLEKEVSVNCPTVDRTMNSPDKVVRLARDYLRMHEETEEYLYMVCLNTKLVMTGVFELSHGNVNSSIVGIREMFQKALLANAVNVIVMHNHPSGNCKPSSEDVRITKKMIEAGNIIGIDVLDHLIVAGREYYSLKDKGHI